jgi:isoleucyl-tRNA synthetase
MSLKTHGLILDEANEKMSKTQPELLIDTEDLIMGSEKLDGTRSYGFGTDVLRLWAATLDDDKNKQVEQEDLVECNNHIKVFRTLMRHILGNLNGF